MKSSSTSHFNLLWRRLIHGPLTACFGLTLKHKVVLLRNDYRPDGKPTIYAATHVFYDDIAAISCCLKNNAYLLFGNEDPDSTPSGIDRIALSLNGIISVSRDNKVSRAAAKRKMVEVLKKHGDILYFPEGLWNLTPNLLVQKLSWGIFDVAENAGANIVPVTVDLVNDEYCVIIGGKFDYLKYPSKNVAIEGLRDMMATMVYELIEMKPPAMRDTLNDDYWLRHIAKQFAKIPRRDRSKDESYAYHPKGETSLGELLAGLHGIEYRSMAADYGRWRQIEGLIELWNR